MQIGEYQKGNDADADRALEKIGAVNTFLRQGLDEHPDFESIVAALKKTAG